MVPSQYKATVTEHGCTTIQSQECSCPAVYGQQIKNTKSIHVNISFYNTDTTYQLFTGENSQRAVVPKLFLFVDPHNLAHINMDYPDDCIQN